MNRKIKKIFALLLIAAMVFSLCACGDKKPSGGGEQEATPEYIYSSSYKTIAKNDASYYPSYADETGFYCTVQEVVGKDIPEGKVEEWEGQYDVYETFMYRIDFDGNVTKLDGYSPIKVDSEHDVSSYIQDMCSDGNGGFIVYENAYSYWVDAPEGVTENDPEYYDYYNYEEHYYLRRLDSNGAEISSTEIAADNSNGRYFYINDIKSDKNGNIYLACDDQGIKVYDNNFNPKTTIEVENWVDQLCNTPDGNVGMLQWNENGYELRMIDPASMKFTDTYTLPGNAYNAMPGGGDYDLYYTSGVSFYGYDLETGKEERIFSWIACDVDNDRMGATYVRDDGSVVGITNNWDSNWENVTSELVTISKVPYDSVPHKATITLATRYLDYSIRSYIIDFNRNNPSTRIDVKEYNDIDQLNTEIMAGNYPDIIDTNTIPLDRLIARGLLENLYPYIEADPEINVNDIFPAVLKAAETDGKLYATVSNFTVQTVVGAASVVGDTPGWTYEDLYAAIATMPEGCTIFDNYFTRDTVLNYCLYLESSNLVNWETGECNFDSQTFKGMLEFAKRFPAEFDWDNEEYVDSYEAISQGKQMLLNAYIYSFDDVMQYPGLFGGDMTFIGFPTYDGVGSMLQLENQYAMFNTCANKDAAWQFLRIMFTEKYQSSNYSLPTNMKVFDAKLKEAMTPTYRTDENGNFILDADGNKIEDPKYTMGWGEHEIKIYALSQEMADQVRSVIDNCTRILHYDDQLYSTVWEESAPFFEGQKTADDVARLIQNKVSIYVNEQR